MKDLPFHPCATDYSRVGHLTTVSFSLGKNKHIQSVIYVPFEKHDRMSMIPNTRLWQFFHVHYQAPFHKDDSRTFHHIEEKCPHCDEKFPPFESLVTMIRLLAFNNKIDVTYGDIKYIDGDLDHNQFAFSNNIFTT
jgi:hypothetical protein